MATIATDALEVIGFWGYPGLQPEVRFSEEGASETFKRGAFILDDGAGRLQDVASDNDADVVGVAAEDGHNNATEGAAAIKYNPLVPGLLLEANMLEASDAAHVLAQTDLWVAMQYQLTGTNVYMTADTVTTTPRLYSVAVEIGTDKGVIGDSNARCLFVPVGSLMAVSTDI